MKILILAVKIWQSRRLSSLGFPQNQWTYIGLFNKKMLFKNHFHKSGHVMSKMSGIWEISFQSRKMNVIITSLIV